MRNIQPWCISRQLWWGHRIPAWYGPDGHIIVGMDEADAADQALAHYGETTPLRRTTMCWTPGSPPPCGRSPPWAGPEQTEDLRRFYPTNTLVTGFDIIFFWVARMMMMGLHFTGQAPFARVFINALIRDAEGAKMSKSKGNVMDPLELVDEFGADALRFTLVAMSGQARDIKLAKPRIEGYRNLGTKLWNAARFCEMNGAARVEGFDPAAVTLTVNRWVRGETVRAVQTVTKALENLRLRRGGDRPLPLHLECVLRLVRRVRQADPARRRPGGQGRDPSHGGLGAGDGRSSSSTPSRPSSPRPCGPRRRTATAC